MGSGYAGTDPYKDVYWRDSKKLDYYVDIEFDVLLNPFTQDLLSLENLRKKIPSDQNWTPQGSGITIRPEVLHRLELGWSDFPKKVIICLRIFIFHCYNE